MSSRLDRNHRSRIGPAVLVTLVIALTTSTAAAGPAGAAAAATTCTAGAPPVTYLGQSYCPGTAIGVQNTAYGVGRRIVLTGVTVSSITGTKATFSSITATSCPPNRICGATVVVTETKITASVSGLAPRPTVGSFGDLYGITSSGTLTATGFLTRDGTGGCTDPDFC